jgi:hypothetical protein
MQHDVVGDFEVVTVIIAAPSTNSRMNRVAAQQCSHWDISARPSQKGGHAKVASGA